MSKIELFESERAAGYNQFVGTWIPNYHYFLDQLPRLLKGTNYKNVLVAGCGTGNEMKRFTADSEQWRITGVDPSPDMIRQARETLQGKSDVTLIEGLVTDLDINEKYGAATLLLVLHFLEDDGSKLSLLKSIADRLIPGAILVMLDITGDKDQIRKNLEILRHLLPDGLEEEQIQSRLNRIENELYAVSEERLAELFIEAGFDQPLRFFQSSIYMGWLARKR